MADHHDEDAPDVDYEGEEDDEDHHHVETPSGAVLTETPTPAAAGKAGAGDSETESDDDDDDAGPRPPPGNVEGSGDKSKKGAGKNDADSEEDGEIDGGNGKNSAAAASADSKATPSQRDTAEDRGYRGAPSSKMDRALDAPRETPSDVRKEKVPNKNNNNNNNDSRDGERGSRWGGRVEHENNDHRRDRNGNGNGHGHGNGGDNFRYADMGRDADPRSRDSRWGGRVDDHHGPRGSGRGGAMKQPPQEHVSVYIPPAKRRMLEEQRKALEAAQAAKSVEAGGKGAEKKSSPSKGDDVSAKAVEVTPIHIQRQTWESLRRSINGTINRLSPATIKPLIHSLFSEANLVRGRGVLTHSILKASGASPQYAPTYAALMAVVNTKLPECGELLLTRAILAFRRGYRRRDRTGVSSTLALLGHLFNQGMAHELLSLQILTVLLDGDPTEDSVDVAVGYMCVVGRQLTEVSPAGVHAVMERFRGLLHEGSVGRRAQYRIETLLKIKRGGFKDYPTVPDAEDLDLVEREDQITFELGLDDEGLRNEEGLDSFKYDEEYDEKEEEWKKIRAEILGEDSDDSDESGSESGSGSESESDSEDEKKDQELVQSDAKKTTVITDLTETDLVHLRRTIYLTIMSSATFEECTHKLAKMDIPDGKECELVNMIIECCSQERTFLRYYGLVSARFCLLHERWQSAFEEGFQTQYTTIHRLETNKLRNVAKLFGHLLHTDSISWGVLKCIHLNEDETTSSSRIFIKILVQEMAEAMGMVTLKRRFDTDNPDPDGPVGEDAADTTAMVAARNGGHPQGEGSTREWFKGMFPKDNARNTRYAINFFTSIGLGPLTDGMREFLKNAPKLILAQAQAQAAREAAAREKADDESSVISTSSSDTSSFDSSSSSSSSSMSSSSYSSSSSDSRYRRRKSSDKRGRDKKRSGGRRRSRSYSSSSFSSSGSDSSPDSRRGGRRSKKGSSKEKHNSGDGREGRPSNDSPKDGSRDGKRESRKEQDDASSKANMKETGRNRRSVSASPPARRGGQDDRRRRRGRSHSSSSSRSRSPSGRGENKRGDRPSGSGKKPPSGTSPEAVVKTQHEERNSSRKKRARSSSYSSSSSRSRSPPPARKSSRKEAGDDRNKRSSRRRKSHSRSESSGRKKGPMKR